MVSLMSYSVLQERIMTRPYNSFNVHALTLISKPSAHNISLADINHLSSGDSSVRIDRPEFFHNSLFLVLANRLFAAAIAGLVIVVRHAKSDLSSKAALSEYAAISLCNVIATSCQYEALKWLTFPTVTIGKCTKMLPVMLILSYRQGKRYRAEDYGIVAAVLLGCAVMISSGSVVSDAVKQKRFSSSETDTPVGFVLLAVYLVFDAFTSTYQERLFSKYDMSVYNQMLFINVTSAILAVLGLSISGGLVDSLHFLIKYPSILRDITMLSLSAVAGQFAISYTIQAFGALLYAGIMTTRQLLSVVVSDIIFKHGLTAMQWAGALLVFAALFYKIYKKAIASAGAPVPGITSSGSNSYAQQSPTSVASGRSLSTGISIPTTVTNTPS